MTAPTPVDIAVNPNNAAQRYILWGNGRIDNLGGAVPITDGPKWFDRYDQQVGVAIHISNWATGTGYVLDFAGGFQPLGGAPTITTQGDVPSNNNGLPYVTNERRYVGWSWNPNGSGQGYAVSAWGELFEFGGAPDPVRLGRLFGAPVVKGFQMQWSVDGTKKGYILDHSGAVWAEWSAPVPSPPPPYYRGQDVARDLVVTDWAVGKGYVLTGDGATHAFGGAPDPLYGGPYRKGQDVARTLFVLNPSNPVKMNQVHHSGQSIDYFASTPPVVTAGGPTSPVTTTTRPLVDWNFADPQGDTQAEWQLLLFPMAFVTSHTMTDPLVYREFALVDEGDNNPTTRGLTMPVDLANGDYRAFFRGRDTADLWSDWATKDITQDVPLPSTPTGIIAVLSEVPGEWQTNLTATTTAGSTTLVRWEYTDDGGLTYTPVRGAEAVPRTDTVNSVDYDVPLNGPPRGYRAVQWDTDPRVASLPSVTVYAGSYANLGRLGYVLTSTIDPTLGGELLVTDAPNWSREVVAGVFETLAEPGKPPAVTVVSGGRPRSRRQSLGVECDRRAEWDKLAGLIESDSTLVLRDPFGDVMYARMGGGISRSQQWLPPYPEENTPLRHNHKVTIPLIEVPQPKPAVS